MKFLHFSLLRSGRPISYRQVFLQDRWRIKNPSFPSSLSLGLFQLFFLIATRVICIILRSDHSTHTHNFSVLLLHIQGKI